MVGAKRVSRAALSLGHHGVIGTAPSAVGVRGAALGRQGVIGTGPDRVVAKPSAVG